MLDAIGKSRRQDAEDSRECRTGLPPVETRSSLKKNQYRVDTLQRGYKLSVRPHPANALESKEPLCALDPHRRPLPLFLADRTPSFLDQSSAPPRESVGPSGPAPRRDTGHAVVQGSRGVRHKFACSPPVAKRAHVGRIQTVASRKIKCLLGGGLWTCCDSHSLGLLVLRELMGPG